MRFTVVWQRDAINDLASIWLASSDRRGVTAAANCIDRELGTNPDQKGQPFFGDRIFIAEPLAVTYAIKEDDRIVDVLQVWSR
jgi:plasmid stabilization system protein ParE